MRRERRASGHSAVEPVRRTIFDTWVNAGGYEVIVERPDGATLDFDVKFSADITMLTIPDGLLQPGTDYIFQVLAIKKSGNQIITEGYFAAAAHLIPRHLKTRSPPRTTSRCAAHSHALLPGEPEAASEDAVLIEGCGRIRAACRVCRAACCRRGADRPGVVPANKT